MDASMDRFGWIFGKLPNGLWPPSPPPCIENRGIEDNFIFHIECYFFLIHVMKHKCEFNISKQNQSIVQLEDNFIFHIECSYFFIHVMKHKCEFNISKQIQSIVCLIFDLRYILTKNTWWFGKKSTFSTQNILWRAMAGLLSFPIIIISKNDKKYNF